MGHPNIDRIEENGSDGIEERPKKTKIKREKMAADSKFPIHIFNSMKQRPGIDPQMQCVLRLQDIFMLQGIERIDHHLPRSPRLFLVLALLPITT
jgi:hypothetical protein